MQPKPLTRSVYIAIFVKLTFLLISCNTQSRSNTDTEIKPITSVNDFKVYLTSHTFSYTGNIGTTSDYYSYNVNYGFTLSVEDKRSGEKQIYSGIYETKTGKYANTGGAFYYAKLKFSTTEWTSDAVFLVLYNEDLIEPHYNNDKPIRNEDANGLYLFDYDISLSKNYNIYKAM